MIEINEIINTKYDYEHLYLINPFNFRNNSDIYFFSPYTLRFEIKKK